MWVAFHTMTDGLLDDLATATGQRPGFPAGAPVADRHAAFFGRHPQPAR
jgi:hypothetical protein